MRIRITALPGQIFLSTALLLWPFGIAAPQSPNIAKVWSLEAACWQYVQNGDVDRYLTLWHENFVGWPCALGQAHPARKSTIGDWVRRIRVENYRWHVRPS